MLKRSLVVLLIAGLLMSVRSLEAQDPNPPAGGAYLPNTVLRIAGVWLNNKLLWDYRAPTIASGFNTGTTIQSNNGTATFRVKLGTGITGTGGVLTMPRAAAGWNCVVNDTSVPAGQAMLTKVTASTQTTVTVAGYRDDGAASGWNSATTLIFACAAY